MSLIPATARRPRTRRTTKPDPARRDPTLSLSCARSWRINGFPATIHIWTDEAWRRMKQPPDDAQYFDGCGVWAALRMDDVEPGP